VVSFFDRRPGLRWAVPAGTATALVAGAALGPVGAVADAPLPERTAQDLLVDLQQAAPTALSGTVEIRTDLGLPDLPMGVMPGTGPMALIDGENTVRVWTDGAERARLALIERAAETTVISTGSSCPTQGSSPDLHCPTSHRGMGSSCPAPRRRPPSWPSRPSSRPPRSAPRGPAAWRAATSTT
jgi:hypothetical protein